MNEAKCVSISVHDTDSLYLKRTMCTIISDIVSHRERRIVEDAVEMDGVGGALEDEDISVET